MDFSREEDQNERSHFLRIRRRKRATARCVYGRPGECTKRVRSPVPISLGVVFAGIALESLFCSNDVGQMTGLFGLEIRGRQPVAIIVA